jgi:DDE family transposase
VPPLPLPAVFADLPDPRRETANQLHRLADILTIATCAVIGGAESWEAIAEYGRTKTDFFRRFLPLDNGVPSPDTFERVFAKLAPGAFAQAFGRWMAGACEATGLIPIAIGGKSARRAKGNTADGGERVGHREPADARAGGRP